MSRGGHSIPHKVVLRRYDAGLRNMRHLFLPMVDEAEIYDNTQRTRVLIAEKRESQSLLIHDAERWAKIEEVSR